MAWVTTDAEEALCEATNSGACVGVGNGRVADARPNAPDDSCTGMLSLEMCKCDRDVDGDLPGENNGSFSSSLSDTGVTTTKVGKESS